MKNSTFRNLTAVFLLVSLVSSPALVYAKNEKEKNKNSEKNRVENVVVKNNSNDDDENESDNNTNSGQNKCWQAYGHLFAFGWLKKNERPQIDINCFLPFGIGKKLNYRYYNNNNATTTPDTNAPVINNIASSTNSTSATISWTTDERSDSVALWSTTAGLASTSSLSKTSGVMTRNHSLKIDGLSASTTYYAVVRSKDASGNIATSSEFTFTTKGTPSDTNPPVISSVIAIVGTSTANVSWLTNESATSKIYFGTTTPLGKTASTTSSAESTTLNTVHFLYLSNLSTSTTYYAIVESKDAAGNISSSPQFSFTTSN